MARSRKPLIEPGSVLPAEDTLSRILERDRAQAGRKPPTETEGYPPESERKAQGAAREAETSPTPKSQHPTPAKDITSNITAHINSQQEISAEAQKYANEYKSEYAQKDAQQRSSADALKEAKQAQQKYSRAASSASRIQEVQNLVGSLAATRPIPITLRLPEGLNDWLDDYAHAQRKNGIKKQDLVSRAVQLLILELTDTETRNV